MNRLFVYGTLKSDRIQEALFGEKQKKYEAILNNYSVYEAEDGWYFIKEKKGCNIKGYVIELDDRNLEICDAFEFCPSMYKRERTTVSIENEDVEVFVYNRVDIINNYKEVLDFDTYSKFSEDEVINTEIKEFKEKEHPEFYC